MSGIRVGEELNWLRRVISNKCIDYHRANKEVLTMEVSSILNRKIIQESKTTFDNYENEFMRKQYNDILKSIEQLPKMQRKTFELFEISNWSHKQISQSLNVAESTSKTNLLKAKKKIRELLKYK